MRAWIEIINGAVIIGRTWVALFMRAWIEMSDYKTRNPEYPVALFMRAWIEIDGSTPFEYVYTSPSS